MYTIRLAEPSDYETFARLYPELHAGDPLPTAEQFASRMLPRVVILEDASAVTRSVGYAHWQFYGRTCHLVHVVVGADARGRGAGAALVEDVKNRARNAGCSRVFLNVRKDNDAAIRLYRRCGFHVEQDGWSVSISWSALMSIDAGDARTVSFAPGPKHDTEIATRLMVDAERIALVRARPEIVLVALREGAPRSSAEDHGAIVAFAAFDVNFPGVYPIRVARASLAGALFRALRPFAKHDHLRTFIEGDRALFELLHAQGAELELELHRMARAL